jgi:hypothetical protein
MTRNTSHSRQEGKQHVDRFPVERRGGKKAKELGPDGAMRRKTKFQEGPLGKTDKAAELHGTRSVDEFDPPQQPPRAQTLESVHERSRSREPAVRDPSPRPSEGNDIAPDRLDIKLQYEEESPRKDRSRSTSSPLRGRRTSRALHSDRDSRASTPINDSRDPDPESPGRDKRSRSKPKSKSKSRPVSVEQSDDEWADSPIEQSPSRSRKMATDIKNHIDNAGSAKRFVPAQQSNRGPRRVHDMWWAWGFILIFLGYLGVSGWVNYQAFLIKDQAAEGPVDRCVGSSHLVQE